MSSRRSRRRGAASLAALCFVGAWIGVRYWPRQRSASPAQSALLASLGPLPPAAIVAWLPFPHQNLARWHRAVGSLPEWLKAGFDAASARRKSRDPGARGALRLPSSGPWAAPPASEMVVWVDPETAVAEVRLALLPEVRWLLRIAGLLASNPWLRGGRVRSGEVWWADGVWCFRTDASPARGDRPLDSLVPAEAEREDFSPSWPDELALAAISTPTPTRARAGVALCHRTPSGWGCGESWSLPQGAGGLWGWPSAEGGWFLLPSGQVRGLPLGVVRRSGQDEPKLPLEDLLQAAQAVSIRQQDGWEAAVSGSRLGDAAAELLRRVEPWNLPRGFRSGWLRPEGVALIAEAHRIVEKLPLISPADRARWQDLEVFLRPFAEQGLSVGWIEDAEHRPFSLVVEVGERSAAAAEN